MDARNTPVPASPTPPLVSSHIHWTPVLQYGLAFVLGGLTLLLLQYAFKKATGGQPSEVLRHEAFRIDLNQADRATLMQLPRIGPHRADRIIQHRDNQGGFEDVADLAEIKGLGPKTVDRLRPKVTVAPDPTPAKIAGGASMDESRGSNTVHKTAPERPIDLNVASREELMRLPGIGPTLAERIVVDRRLRGPFSRVEDVTRVSGIKGKTLEKLLPHVCVSEP